VVHYDSGNVVRDVTFQIVLAMTHYQTGKGEQARSELAEARQKIENQFNGEKLNGDTGYWFDWVFARILLREATALMAESKG
jgi:uncharacterized radical SAM superfamily Fe-S cluster-containing enzyme